MAAFAKVSGDVARTVALPFAELTPTDVRYQNYYRTAPNTPFCRRDIDPKLADIRRHFANIALSDESDVP